MASQKLSKNILISEEPSYMRRPPRTIKRGSFLVVAERRRLIRGDRMDLDSM